MNMQLQGRHIVITGAASGIGRASAEMLPSHGEALTLLDREVVNMASSSVTSVLMDANDEDAVGQAIASENLMMGGIDGVVKVAGIVPIARLEDTALKLWQSILAVNLTQPFLKVQSALPNLRAAGSATVVNISSASAIFSYPDLGAYGASKGGLSVVSKVWAAELGPSIRVNVVAIGMTRTRIMNDWYTDEEQLASRSKTLNALQRIGEPTEISEGILFLTSHASSVVTRVTLTMNGGRTYH